MLVLLLGARLLSGCTAPATNWPGLVLVDRSALDLNVAFLDAGAPLRTADDPLVIEGVSEVLDADLGELIWVTAEDGQVDFESWMVGEDLDPDAVDLYTRDGSPPDIASVLQTTPIRDEATGGWRIEAPDVLLTVATSDQRDVVDVLPVPLDAADAGSDVDGSRESAGDQIRHAAIAVPRGGGRAAVSASRARGGIAFPAAFSASKGETDEAAEPSACGLDAAGLVGLHEAAGRLLLLAADGTWRGGLDRGAPSGRWRVASCQLILAQGEISDVVAVNQDEINFSDLPF